MKNIIISDKKLNEIESMSIDLQSLYGTISLSQFVSYSLDIEQCELIKLSPYQLLNVMNQLFQVGANDESEFIKYTFAEYYNKSGFTLGTNEEWKEFKTRYNKKQAVYLVRNGKIDRRYKGPIIKELKNTIKRSLPTAEVPVFDIFDLNYYDGTPIKKEIKMEKEMKNWNNQSGKIVNTGITGTGSTSDYWKYIKNELINKNIVVPVKIQMMIDQFIHDSNVEINPLNKFMIGLNKLSHDTGMCVVGPQGVIVTSHKNAKDYDASHEDVKGTYQIASYSKYDDIEWVLELH